ncbi:MAG: ABC transporter permease [Thermomicrobiales bacterium]
MSSGEQVTSPTVSDETAVEAEGAQSEGLSQLTRSIRPRTPTWRILLQNPRVTIPGAAILLLLVMALFAPWLAPKDPLEINAQIRLEGPSSEAWLGTDENGRDLLSRIIVGSRTSMTVAILSVTVATILGVGFGLIGGYFGGIWEFITMRSVDVLLVFPPILLAISVVAFLGPSTRNLILVIGLLYMTRFARIAFGSVVQVKGLEYVEAARVLGAGNTRILGRYILPNILAPIFVQISLSLGFAILLESGLSFLGLGTPPPNPSWGNMIGAARGYLQQNAWFVFWPSLIISIAILSFNTLGDGLRDSLDPRLRQ